MSRSAHLALPAILTALAILTAQASAGQNVRFVDRTATSGLVVSGLGRGVAVTDFDGDGDDDLFVAMQYGPSHLFANDGTAHFTNVTSAAGLSMNGRYMAPVWADFDNDGHPDLFVGGYDTPNRIWRNRGNGTFEPMDTVSGMDPDLDVGSLAIADYDGDGLVDLFLAVDRAPDRLYRNRGGFVFEDVSAAAGIAGLTFSVAMQTTWADYDHDGDQDLFVVHDGEGRQLDGTVNPMAANRLHRNFGYLPLLDQATTVGFRDPGAGNSMAIAWADYDGDGWEDAYVSRKDYAGLYRNLRNGTFETVPAAAGAERNGMSWGTLFGDYDNDGDPDLYVLNAYGYYRMPSIMYENRGGTFVDVSVASGTALQHEAIGLASADFNGDGQLDLVFSAYDGFVHLLEGASPASGHHVRVRLKGVQSNAMAIGARVELRAGGRTWTQFVSAGDSYCSQSSATLHFGIGALDRVDEVRVYWGGRYVDVLPGVAAGTTLDVTQTGAVQTGVEAAPAGPTETVEDGITLGMPYPNPAAAVVSIPYSARPGETPGFELVDLLGRVVSTPAAPGSSGRIMLDTSRLDPGLYWLRMTVGRTIRTRSIVTAR